MQRMFPCPTCGAQISIGQPVCGACGESFQYRCAHCGAIPDTVSEFCTNCGEGLCRQTGLTEPLPKAARSYQAYQGVYGYGGQGPQPKKTDRRLGAFLGSMAVMLCIVAVFYAIVTSSQGDASRGVDLGFIFKETVPASGPTPPPSTEAEAEPVVVTDLPQYTAQEVAMLAKSFSPDCRVSTAGRT